MAGPLRHGYWPRCAWSPFPPLFHRLRCSTCPVPVASPSVVSPSGGDATNLRQFFSSPRSRLRSFTSPSPTSSGVFGSAVSLQPARGLVLPGDAALDSESDDDASSSESTKKSRNQFKREARRSVQWGMDLAEFSPPQIKRILTAPRLELGLLVKDIYEAIMLVKRLGPEVREGKRRQFNYIGRLLREAELPDPDLLEAIIQALKDHDSSKFQALSGQEAWRSEDEEEEEEEEVDTEEESQRIMDTTTRWYNGLINQDSAVAKEVYSLYDVEFDRQDLRKLVRKVQTLGREGEPGKENGANTALTKAKGSLLRFLRGIARQTSLVA